MSVAEVLGASPPEAGILWVYRFSDDGTAQAVAGPEIDRALAQPRGWLWIHAGLADARCRLWLERTAPISATAREVLLGIDEHLRLDVVQDEIIGVIADFERALSQQSDTFARLRFVMTERLLITARRHALHSIELAHRSVERGTRFATPASLLDGIVDHFADAIGRLSEDLGHELDVVEERVLRDDLSDERQRIARSRLQVVRVRRHLSQMKSLFHRLEARIGSEHATGAATFRALAQKLDALDHDVGGQERSRLLQDEVAAKMQAITNRRLFTLSMLTACLLPPTLVTGVFGMNTKDLPFQQLDGGTWYALVLAAAAGAFAYWALHRLRAL